LALLGGLGLLQDLSSAGSTLSGRSEFSHVFSVSLDLFLLGVDAGGEKAGRRSQSRLGDGREGLCVADDSDNQKGDEKKSVEHSAIEQWE